MLGTMARLYAYSKWPRTTFALTHPKTTAHLAKMRWDLKHAYAPRVSAITTAIIALPFGYMVGRALRGADDVEEAE